MVLLRFYSLYYVPVLDSLRHYPFYYVPVLDYLRYYPFYFVPVLDSLRFRGKKMGAVLGLVDTKLTPFQKKKLLHEFTVFFGKTSILTCILIMKPDHELYNLYIDFFKQWRTSFKFSVLSCIFTQPFFFQIWIRMESLNGRILIWLER